jgi:NADP-dependent 3-hydroxy acid dehydrogenase YdfG
MLRISTLYPAKRAFITGAASGLGKAFCLHLAADGWTIVMTDYNTAALEETKKIIESAGAKVHSYILDVTNREQYANLVDTVIKTIGGIDVLINNAGVGVGDEMGDYALEDWDWMIDINLKGVIYGCHLFMPVLKEQKAGVIINVSSLAAIVSPPGTASYNVTKAGVMALSETLCSELDMYNIKVGCLMPAFFQTNLLNQSRGNEKLKQVAGKLMQKSDFSAADVALEALEKTAIGKLFILYPKESRQLYILKRLMPIRFRKLITNKWNEVKRKSLQKKDA